METQYDANAIRDSLDVLMRNASLLSVSQVKLIKGLTSQLKRTGSLSDRQAKLVNELKLYLEDRL